MASELEDLSFRRGLAAAAAILLAVYFATPGFAADVVWNVAALSILTIAAIHANGFGRNRGAWLAVIAGHACFVIGDVAYAWIEQIQGAEAFPSLADVAYLAGYPIIALGLLSIVRSRRQRRDVGVLIDTAIITAAATALMWVYVMDGAARDTSASVLERVVALAYPAGDLVVLAVVTFLAVRRSTARRPFWILAASLGSMLVADVAFAVMSLDDSYTLGNPVEALWWASYTLLALAVLHPDCEQLGASAVAPTRLTSKRLAAMGTAALLAPTAIAIGIGIDSRTQVVVLCVATIVVFALVITRLQLIARELDDQRDLYAHEANHDPLTGLANRALFAREVRRSIDELDGSTDRIALLVLDLDQFKTVNDLLGHPAGDELLRVIADRLGALVRDDDVVARLGGDEFGILLRRGNADTATTVADRTINAIRESADVGGPVRIYPDASVGIVLGTATSTTEGLLRDADVAMYAAKRRGKGQWATFHDGIGEHEMEWLELRADLPEALTERQLFLEYQPIVDIETGDVVGGEALLRWQHPVHGRVGPDRFVPIAEDCGLIAPIGAWVLRTACRAAQPWRFGDSAPYVSVNISPVQLASPHLVDDVKFALVESGLEPHRLVLEITETANIDDDDAAAAVMQRLRELGVRVALDDLGGGFASLQYLRSFPIDVAKLDRSFMSRLDQDDGLLPGLVRLVDALGLVTVLEGVDSEHHESVVRDLGVRYVQGFLYSRPLRLEHFESFLASYGPVASLDEARRRRARAG